MIERIKEILETKVAPELMLHGGDIELVGVENDGEIVKVKFHGACKTCPSAQMTIENVVAEHLKRELTQVREVILIQDMPEDMLTLAKQLLKK